MQREIRMLGEAQRPKLISNDLLNLCRDRMDAIRLCVQLSKLPNQAIAESLSIDKGHWSRIMQGQANFPDSKSIELMLLCGNYAPLQYEAMATGFDLVEKNKDQRIKELEDELLKLKTA